MNRYLLNDEVEVEEFYVYDDGKDITIRDDLDGVPEDEKKNYKKESISYKVPSWNAVTQITEMALGGMSPFPNSQVVDRFLIMLFLHKASFFEIKRTKPEEADAPEQVVNIDEMLGPKGVVPKLISKIVLTLRRRL